MTKADFRKNNVEINQPSNLRAQNIETMQDELGN